MHTNTAKAAPPDAADTRFGSALTPGLADRLGERFLTVDAADSTPLELLRFRSEVATAPGFEDALREQITRLAHFKDLGFATVRDLSRQGDQLTLISTHVAGQRLSDMAGRISKARRVTFVIRLLRDTTRALAALESAAPGVTHGALTGERIILTPEGRVCITEYTLAPALQELALWPEELWTDFGLLARGDEEGEAIFDPRTTVMQLGVVAVSVLLGRQISLQDIEQRLPALLDDVSALAARSAPATAGPLREWLERALATGTHPYVSVGEAETGLRELLAGLGPAGTVEVDTIHMTARTEAPAATSHDARQERPVAGGQPKPPAAAATPAPMALTVPSQAGAIDVTPASKPWRRPDVPRADEDVPWANRTRTSPWREKYLLWAAIAVAAIAVGEAIAIARLMTRPPTVVLTESSVTIESAQPGDTVVVDGQTIGATPLKVRVNPKTQAIKLVAAAAPPPTIDPQAAAAEAASERAAAALEAAAARQRSGGVAITSPIQLTVLEGDRVLGVTTDGPIVASAGRHQLDFVNSALGYRSRQTITIRQGVITPLTIAPPMGRISINAQPWADVLIDDTAVGQTPLANVAVPIGEHQITFRHPQLGERRERVTVRADQPARVSTSLQQR